MIERINMKEIFAGKNEEDNTPNGKPFADDRFGRCLCPSKHIPMIRDQA